MRKPQNLSCLYANIQALCKEKGITIACLERNTDLGNGVIRKWDKASPQLRTVTAVANYLGVTVDELLAKHCKDCCSQNP